MLAARHGARVVGVDLSSAVEKAKALCEGYPAVSIVQADLTRLPLAEGVFDLAFSIGVLHHGPDPRGAFREVARRVKPGGRLARGIMAPWLRSNPTTSTPCCRASPTTGHRERSQWSTTTTFEW